MNQRYFYLNDKKQLQGPHSMQQLEELCASGSISEDTLVAMEGGDQWQPFRALRAGGTSSSAMPAIPAAPAASAGGETTVDETPKGFIDNAVYSWKKIFIWKGRATRAEFWSLLLFNFLLSIGLSIVFGLGAAVSMDIMNMLQLVAFAAFCLVTFSAMVRRFHDVGVSTFWAIFSQVLPVITISYAVWQVIDTFARLSKLFDWDRWVSDIVTITEGIQVTGATPEANEALSALFEELTPFLTGTLEYTFGVIMIGIVIIPTVCALGCFIISLIDSQRKTNKYGVSPKYPQG